MVRSTIITILLLLFIADLPCLSTILWMTSAFVVRHYYENLLVVRQTRNYVPNKNDHHRRHHQDGSCLLLQRGVSSSLSSSPSLESSDASSLIERARRFLQQNDTDTAYDLLLQAAQQGNGGAMHTIPGLLSTFEELFRTKIALQEDEEEEINNSSKQKKKLSIVLDRMGLASLLSDQGRYQDAATELGIAVKLFDPTKEEGVAASSSSIPQGIMDKATSMLFRTRAAICEWEDYNQASRDLVSSLQTSLYSDSTTNTQVPSIHPFEALTWPCVNLEDATRIGNAYAMRANEAVYNYNGDDDPSTMARKSLWNDIDLRLSRTIFPNVTINSKFRGTRKTTNRRIKVGYISPDFTGRHPLAFLMQDVFRFHDPTDFEIFLYSLEETDGSIEVEKIQAAASSPSHFHILRGNVETMTRSIQNDTLDILVDLCGYTGTSVVAEIMAQRTAAPIQVSYMGFPGSSGAPYIDWMVADPTVIPPHLRSRYTESILFMPHCYFVNSHQFLSQSDATTNTTNANPNLNPNPVTRSDYKLPASSSVFVFCCHSRPDKIDPVTFATWIRALDRTRRLGRQLDRDDMSEAVLWLLRSDPVMENNLRRVAETIWSSMDTTSDTFPHDCLVFCDKTSREEHLQRLQLADVFLDTPAYNAHTVGCDCLSVGVPMISLLQNVPDDYNGIGMLARPSDAMDDDGVMTLQTDKLASRVGASLLKSAQGTLFDRLVVPTMEDYEDCMVDCARTGLVKERQGLLDTTTTTTTTGTTGSTLAPLWDTERWVRNLEAGLEEMVELHGQRATDTDIYVLDD
ncbi:glycosyl transferase family 41 protein [Nitzschia inconspicua]|uniref:Glycosyl transferase family 41 protein n=1 Tax=Nitzschia inconspicua TaxID=303405 RepID=A0A9K3PZS0_9STRA|nr:glycosyl transferase family 41 protein [Nitzschia inconspicua]